MGDTAIDKPLTGYKVLDLTIARAGPTAVRLLADWGADVVRIEPTVATGPNNSLSGPHEGSDQQNLHRNKRGLALNLKHPAGAVVFKRMVAKSDIVVENFRSDVKQRLGIEYEDLKKENPGIILASISGFGQTGPYQHRPGVDQIVQGSSGLMSVTGAPGAGPMRAGIAVSDTSAGMFLGQGILLALLHRMKTGEGQWVHTSLLEAMLSKLDFQGSRYTMDGEIAAQEGNFHPTLAPMGMYAASDGYVNLAASSGKMWINFCKTLDAQHLLESPQYANGRDRYENREQLNREVNELCQKFSMTELVEKLNAVGVPCGPINNIGEAFEDEQVKHLRMVKPAHHDLRGDLSLVRSPINLSLFPESDRFLRAGPGPGQHSVEVLREFGLDRQEVDELVQLGAIQSNPLHRS
ncbi:MAG: crotonobetainyl-CoA:carnitine CoA-transferase CaiB-like acyl-CoA transferase [Candidatus Azotimanducaceae bacterium]|jgi:crotonobetainyl-CoA:carnitine CoA-transferase CaiB-like acyl-CoA transferase